MAKGIIRLINRTRAKIARQIAQSIDRDNKYSRGLAYEGYQGGYIAALDDVVLALGGTLPQRNGWWEAAEPADAPDGLTRAEYLDRVENIVIDRQKLRHNRRR